MAARKHNDCRNFATVDAFKGICRVTGKLVSVDSDTCPEFTQLAKCANCAKFKAGEDENMGCCTAMKEHFWAYPEMVAVTCEMYDKK